ncbi:myb-like DNA-binding domain-containing protein [Trichoderma breve]|uniref:Myb-like DNA-binding domain-containing protein n=1 Tax=Trichoderma breve TaxID=2034170 RepID=A0A9W9B6V5_9HYPO|nr:myb-like DNA-binding domain-containing protein [Trichoderma breve]KAJ4854416.1 myb-like DNA-binding domain-containing protein [Trichoderma breve]
MQQWQVGPVPDYVYSNSPHPSNDMHNHPYPADMARRNDRMEFPYGAQPNMAAQQQHHPTPVQPPMSVSQQPPNGPPSQQQTPTQPAAQPPNARSRKRPAQNAAPSPATAAAPPPAAPPQAQPTANDNANSTDAASGPPTKKSRTNTPWTPQEELRLKQMRDAGNSWAEIAKTFPTRTEGSVKKHWYKDMHYAEFAEDESQALLNAIKEYENNKWKVIGQKVGKPAKACEQYAKEHFPDLFGNPKGR